MQLRAQGSGNSCGAGGKLVLAQRDLRDIFIASTAELPGLLVAALVMDPLGRKWYALPCAAAIGSVSWTWKSHILLKHLSSHACFGEGP